MRKMIVSEFLTLDGVMEDPGGGDKTPHGGWAFKFQQSPEQMQYKHDELFASDALLLGRITYQGFAAAWPNMQGTGDFGERMNSIRKVVVSTTLTSLDWNNSVQIKNNVVEEITKLKQESGKDILIAGSGSLIQTLMQHNLIDEYRLMVHPIVVGGGKRLFRDGLDQKVLKLVEVKPFSSGITLMTYQPA